MIKEIIIENKKINYLLKNSYKAKNLRLTIRPGSGLIVTKPRWISVRRTEKFIFEKSNWILSKLNQVKKQNVIAGTRSDYIKNKIKVLNIVLQKIKYFNEHYNFKHNKVNIKNQKTLWGSCSSAGNLNFNYKLIYLSDELINYIVVHELCHLKELNHSIKFWRLVKEAVPNYKILRKKLKKII